MIRRLPLHESVAPCHPWPSIHLNESFCCYWPSSLVAFWKTHMSFFSRPNQKGWWVFLWSCKANSSPPFSPCLAFTFLVFLSATEEWNLPFATKHLHWGVGLISADQIQTNFIFRCVSSCVYLMESQQKSQASPAQLTLHCLSSCNLKLRKLEFEKKV